MDRENEEAIVSEFLNQIHDSEFTQRSSASRYAEEEGGRVSSLQAPEGRLNPEEESADGRKFTAILILALHRARGRGARFSRGVRAIPKGPDEDPSRRCIDRQLGFALVTDRGASA